MLALLVIAACARPAPPRAPSAIVRAEIEQAEAAERARRHDVARTHYQRAVAAARDPASIAFARREYAETLMTLGRGRPRRSRSSRAWSRSPPTMRRRGTISGSCATTRATMPGRSHALERARALAPRRIHAPAIALAALRWKRGDREGARAEYRALLELELPDRLRAKVKWALAELARPGH